MLTLTQSQRKILLRLTSDSRLVISRAPRAGFFSITTVANVPTGKNRVGQKFQAKVVYGLQALGYLKVKYPASEPGEFIVPFFELTESGKTAAAELAEESSHETAREVIARRSR